MISQYLLPFQAMISKPAPVWEGTAVLNGEFKVLQSPYLCCLQFAFIAPMIFVDPEHIYSYLLYFAFTLDR